MVVVSRTNGLGQGAHAPSRTMVFPPAPSRLHMAQQAAGGWAQMGPAPRGYTGLGYQRYPTGLGRYGYRGLGAVTVPQWVWWGAGGLALGVGAMFVASRMKKRRR